MKSQKILIGGLVLMVLLNIGTLGYILLKPNHGGRFGGHRMGEKHGGGGPGRFIGKRLHFSEEQEAALDKLREEHFAKLTVQREKIDTLRKQLLALVKTEPYDAAKADAITTEIGKSHAEIEKEMASHFTAIKAMCTKDQLVEFDKFIDRIGEHKPGFGFGKHKGRGDKGWDSHDKEGKHGDRRDDRNGPDSEEDGRE